MFRYVALVSVLLVTPVRAGLYYSGEPLADLPSQWRGFVPDHRALRMLAAQPGPNVPAMPLRDAYRSAAEALTKAAAQKQLTADEAADLGALHFRLGAIDSAINVLRAAQRQHSDHFRIAANLGTAWHVKGDLDQAAQALRESVRLAPATNRKVEELHLKLVTLRRNQPRGTQTLDDLFGVRFIGEKGEYTPDSVAAAEKAKLPADVVELVQQLALSLPADGRLLWQLGELANAYGDVRSGASLLDACMTELGMGDPDLRRHRLILRTAAEQLTNQPANVRPGALVFKSPRPLARRLDATNLPAIRADGVNPISWALLNSTTLDEKFKPTFPEHLQKLKEKKVYITGFLIPMGEDEEAGAFLLIEDPFCCLFCELPAEISRLYFELPEGQTFRLTRNPVTITGRLVLNSTDPDACFYSILDAMVDES